MTAKASLVPHERIERAILRIRGHKVMLDADLAELYGVQTRELVQAVKRNLERFPDDFMFPLTNQEFVVLRSQSVTSRSWGGRRTPPLAFTEQGVAMLSSVLRSKRAVQVNVEIVRAFVKLRTVLASHVELRQKLVDLERKVGHHDHQIQSIFDAIRKLIEQPPAKTKKIGFV